MRFRYLLYILSLAIFSSCEDVIDVEVPKDASRLVVDGIIRINESEPMTNVRISISLTSSFFEEPQTAVVDELKITNTDLEDSFENPNFVVLVSTEPGVYEAQISTDFLSDGNLQLSVMHKGQNYLAETNYVPGVPIDTVEQGTGTLFSGNETEIIVAFTDDGTRDDFYLFDFGFNEYLVTEDEFYQGQTFLFSYFYEEGLDSDQEIDISLLGVDEQFYNYIAQVTIQAGGDQGPFQTPAATVRGNVINVSDLASADSSNNFALGYFAVVQEYKKSITIE